MRPQIRAAWFDLVLPKVPKEKPYWAGVTQVSLYHGHFNLLWFTGAKMSLKATINPPIPLSLMNFSVLGHYQHWFRNHFVHPELCSRTNNSFPEFSKKSAYDP